MRHATRFAVILLAACGGAEGATYNSAGIATVFRTSGDTTYATTEGEVPVERVRGLALEMQMAPGIDDTSSFTAVQEVDVSPDGRFWVYDRPTNTIFVFSPDGALIRRVGRQGAGPGEFNGDGGMVARADGGLSIWDPRNGRLSSLDANGDFVSSMPVTTGFFTSNALYTDTTGALYLRRPVTPPREGEILGRMGLVRLREGGRFSDSLAPPDIDVPRDFYVATSPDGHGRSSMGARYAPSYHWDWHPDGFFITAHGGLGAVYLNRPQGVTVIQRVSPPVAVPVEERDQEHERIVWNMRQTQPGWTWSGPGLPETKAPIMGVSAMRDGSIWARVAAPSEPIPDAEMPVSRNPDVPQIHWRTPVVYEVYGPTGIFRGRIAMPPRSTLIQADGNTVWVLGRDENDLPAVARYRVAPSLADLDRP